MFSFRRLSLLFRHCEICHRISTKQDTLPGKSIVRSGDRKYNGGVSIDLHGVELCVFGILGSSVLEQANLSLGITCETERFEELSSLNNELIDSQRELQPKNSDLEGVDAFKNGMLGRAVHDLRPPLSVISLYSQYTQCATF